MFFSSAYTLLRRIYVYFLLLKFLVFGCIVACYSVVVSGLFANAYWGIRVTLRTRIKGIACFVCVGYINITKVFLTGRNND